MLRCLLPLRKHPGDVLALQAKAELLVCRRAQIERSVPQPALRTQRACRERPLCSVRVRSDFESFENRAHAQFIERDLNF